MSYMPFRPYSFKIGIYYPPPDSIGSFIVIHIFVSMAKLKCCYLLIMGLLSAPLLPSCVNASLLILVDTNDDQAVSGYASAPPRVT
jgi:hypothetical protein